MAFDPTARPAPALGDLSTASTQINRVAPLQRC